MLECQDIISQNELAFLDTKYKRIGSSDSGVLLFGTTINTTPRYLTKDGNIPQTADNSIILANNTTYVFNIRVQGQNTTNGTFYSIERCCTMRRDGTAASTRLIGAVATYFTTKDTLFVSSIVITANTTLGCINLSVNTGSSANDNINWRADVKLQII